MGDGAGVINYPYIDALGNDAVFVGAVPTGGWVVGVENEFAPTVVDIEVIVVEVAFVFGGEAFVDVVFVGRESIGIV